MNKTQMMSIQTPTPGSSLTDAPKANKWEQPAQFSDPDEAIGHVLNNLTKPAKFAKFLDALDKGVEIEAMVRTLVMTGFSEGKWTPDVGMLIAETLTTMLSMFAQENGYSNHPVRIPREGDVKEVEKGMDIPIPEDAPDSLISKPEGAL